MRRRFLTANISAAALALFPVPFTTARAALPVIDVSSIRQATTSATQNVLAVQKQILQYKTQLDQYQNMLKNTLAPAAYVWSQAQGTIDGLQQSVNSLNFMSQQAGSIDNYLGQFQNADYYRNSPCFSNSGCTPAESAAIQANQRAKQAMAMAGNQAVMRGISAQQSKLTADGATLDQMQRNAQGAEGQMQALGYANQFAANANNQLLAIRGQLMAQQAAATAIHQANLDQEALADAASAQRNNGGANDKGTGKSFTLGSGSNR